MNKINLGGEIQASEISLGCMRISGMSVKEAAALINAALEEGINFFDHADIYGGGKSEEVFSKAIEMNPTIRENILIQSKCGIRSGFFDFSRKHILEAADGCLKRLNTEYLDVLLLHRPDTLFEPEEVAEAFTILKLSGKVRHFGVSNQKPMQIELLQKYCEQKLIVNQLQFSLAHTGMIDSGLNVNMKNNSGIDRDDSILEYCRLKDITIQAWSPFQYGFFEGTFIGSPKYPELNKKLEELSKIKGVTPTALAISWILRHPAKIQAIVGTTNKNRIREIASASTITLSREEWYQLYRAAGNILP